MGFLPEDILNLCLDRAKKLMGSELYNSWLSNASFRSFSNGVFTVGLDSEIRANFVSHNYKDKIEELLREVTNDNSVTVVFTHVPEILSIGKVGNSSRNDTFSNFLKPSYVFSRFVQGRNNNLAFAVAKAIAHEMGYSSANPFFIYGGVGLGKTHLVQAIAHHVKKEQPDKTFCYISSEEFVNGFVNALDPNNNPRKKMETFKNRFRNTHYLIMDDVQFLAGKEGTQDLFFHLFNELYLRGRQIVLTSDRPPHEIEPLEERLISRFQSGMVVDIKPPELETRIAILKQKLSDENINLNYDIIYYLAETVKSNVRQLEGVVNILAANIRIQNMEMSLENVQSIITEYLGAFSKRLNPSLITKTVGEYFNVNPTALKGKQRKREILIPRQIAMYLLRDLTKLSLDEIGAYFGRDHSTVLNAIKRVKTLMQKDSIFKNKITDLKHKLMN